MLDTEAVEYWVFCCTRKGLTTRKGGAGGGRARGRATGGGRDRGFNGTPMEGVLQRELVEYRVLR